MRRLVLLVLLAIAMAGVASSFDARAYLYDGENESMITTSDFSVGGVAYTIVSYNKVETFLLSDGQVISDAQTISGVIRNYQNNVLMPTKEEWAKIKSQVLSFNASRNYKTRFGPAEQVCLDALLVSMYPCDTLSKCTTTATMICAIDPSVLCPPADLLAVPILNYTNDVRTFDNRTKDFLALWNAFTPDNAQSSFKQMQNDISVLKTSAVSISKNPLRFPESGDVCRDCIGRCPATHLDVASLDNASASLAVFTARIGPIGTEGGRASQIAQATIDRQNYVKASALLAQWTPKWNSFKSTYGALSTKAATVSQYVADSEFTTSYSVFKARWADMETKLTTRDFTGVEATFSELSSAASKLNASINGSLEPYNATVDAQDRSKDLLSRARWKVNPNSKESVAGYNALATRKNSLDAQFKPPLTSVSYKALTANYSSLSSDIEKFLGSEQKVTDTVSSFGGQFGSASINGAFTLASAFTPLTYSTRNAAAPFIPPFVLVLTDLAIISVAVVMFVGVLLYFKSAFRNRIVLGLWMVGLFGFLFALGVGSVAIFAFVNSAASSGTYDEFLQQLPRSNAAYIAIDQAGATSSQISAMSSCADTVKGQMKSLFSKPSHVFTFSGKSCAWVGGNQSSNQTLATDSCFDKTVGSSVFVMKASNATHDPKFSTVYLSQVEVAGDEAYYKRCEIGDVLG